MHTLKKSTMLIFQKIVRFLRYQGRSHLYYYHYTTFDKIKLILNNKTLRFTIGDSKTLNDWHEREKTKYTNTLHHSYISCFTTSGDESVAMWRLYSNGESNVVRIQIPQKEFIAWFNSIDKSKISPETKKTVPIKKKILSDISYVRLLPNNNKTSRKQKIQFTWQGFSCDRFFDNKSECEYKDFAGVLKNIAWAYEQECRAILQFDESDTNISPYVDVSIPKDLISSFKILMGPEFQPQKYNELSELCRLHGIKIDSIEQSQVAGKVFFNSAN